MKRVELGNLSMAYDDEGEGPPMVCIHGYPLNRYIWQPQLDVLSKSFRVIVPDLRRHGDSFVREGRYLPEVVHTMDLLADDLVELLDVLNVSQPVVLNGLSMGGYVAFALLRNHPSRVRGMILTASRARSDSDIEKDNRLKAIRSATAQGVASIVDGMLPRLVSPATVSEKPDLVARLRELMLSSSMEGIVGDLKGMMDRRDARPILPEIRVPVLILVGKDDQIIPLDEAQTMNDLITGSRLEIIGNAGHLPNMEQPEFYNNIVETFIHSLV